MANDFDLSLACVIGAGGKRLTAEKGGIEAELLTAKSAQRVTVGKIGDFEQRCAWLAQELFVPDKCNNVRLFAE